MNPSAALKTSLGASAVVDEPKFSGWPFTSPGYEPAVMNGLRTKQILDWKIQYTNLDTLDYFEAHQGKGSPWWLFPERRVNY